MPTASSLKVVSDPAALAREGAEEFVRRAAEAIGARGVFTVVLAGGTTPRGLYTLLAEDPAFRDRVSWDKCHFFFSDERHVPPDHPDSNYRMAYQTLLSKIPAPPLNAHRMATELPDAGQAADHCESILKKFFRLEPGQLPRFDLVLLGMGADGHTASLFPGSEALREKTRLVAAPWVEQVQAFRVTLTPPVLNNAASVVFLLAGVEKAEILREVLEGEHRPDHLPAQLIRPVNGTLLWLVDQAAARSLRNGP